MTAAEENKDRGGVVTSMKTTKPKFPTKNVRVKEKAELRWLRIRGVGNPMENRRGETRRLRHEWKNTKQKNSTRNGFRAKSGDRSLSTKDRIAQYVPEMQAKSQVRKAGKPLNIQIREKRRGRTIPREKERGKTLLKSLVRRRKLRRED